jgi:hypothetical protein
VRNRSLHRAQAYHHAPLTLQVLAQNLAILLKLAILAED